MMALNAIDGFTCTKDISEAKPTERSGSKLA